MTTPKIATGDAALSAAVGGLTCTDKTATDVTVSDIALSTKRSSQMSSTPERCRPHAEKSTIELLGYLIDGAGLRLAITPYRRRD